jgi:prepilin-type N-terminal cleavage/methylation domain-containing protein
MSNKAFTLIELIIIIVVVGILSAAVLPRMERDNLREAAEQVARHIRYTQHLAMVDDVYDNNVPNWHKAMWRISFRNNNCYVVSSNTDLDMNYDRNESAVDPLTGMLLYSDNTCTQLSTDNKDVFLEDRYGIDAITLSPSCGANRLVAFDILGRPHATLGNAVDFITSKCTIKLSSGPRNAYIEIQPQTGYTSIETIN